MTGIAKLWLGCERIVWHRPRQKRQPNFHLATAILTQLIEFDRRVGVFIRYGHSHYVTASKARKLCELHGAIVRKKEDGRVTEISTVDHGLKHEDRPSTSSIQTVTRQMLRGSERIQLDLPRETRIVTTQPCNVFKLKHIPESDRDLYCMAVTDCLPKKSNVDFTREAHSHAFGAA